MVIFAKVYDLLTWLIPRTETFPKAQRFVVTRRLQGAVLDLQELLIEANVAGPGRHRESRLRDADAALLRVRLYLRLAHQWSWLNDGQYAHVSAMVAEIGRLLGGWRRATAGVASPARDRGARSPG